MMSAIKKFSDFFVVYDWLRQWSSDSNLSETEGGFQGAIGSILGIQAQFGIPVMFVSRAEKRIKAVMVGWPTEGLKEGDAFPSLSLPCKKPCNVEYNADETEHVHHWPSAFYIRNLWISPRYAKQKDFGFGEDILSIWPDTKVMLSYDKDQKLKEIWKMPEPVETQEV